MNHLLKASLFLLITNFLFTPIIGNANVEHLELEYNDFESDCPGVCISVLRGEITVEILNDNVAFVNLYNEVDNDLIGYFCEGFGNTPEDDFCLLSGVYSMMVPEGSYRIGVVYYDNTPGCFVNGVVVSNETICQPIEIEKIIPEEEFASITISTFPHVTDYTISWDNREESFNGCQPFILTGLEPCTDYTVTITAQCVENSVSVSQDFTTDGCSPMVDSCSVVLDDISEGVVGDPNNISIPLSQQEVYSGGRQIPTIRQMLGINLKKGNEQKLSQMDGVTDIFSHARVFHDMNKDYWIDNLGPTTFFRPNEDRGNLSLIIDEMSINFFKHTILI